MYMWGHRKRTIWDMPRLDNSDLAVIVACDLTEERIDPVDYLIYKDDYDRMPVVRQCLLLWAKPEELASQSTEELYSYRDMLLKKMFNFFRPDDERQRRFLLQVIQKPISIWGIGCLHIEHCSIAMCMDMNVMRERLREHIGFDYYCRYECCLPIIADIQTEYD